LIEEDTMTFRALDELYEAMISGNSACQDKWGDWRTNLPTFGGPEPEDTAGYWSWDRGRVIVGTCDDDLRILPREAAGDYLAGCVAENVACFRGQNVLEWK
jgi:hypothetical protein